MADRWNYTLYWSSLTTYEDCPQRYLWRKGWPTIDLGFGLGKRKKIPKNMRRSRHFAVMGLVLARFVDRLYNNEEWKHPQGMIDRLLEHAKKDLKLELLDKRNNVDWRLSPSRTAIMDTIEAGVRGYIRTMKANKLLGQYSKAEVDLVAYVDKFTPIGGKADLIIRRDDNGVTILDGKNSKRYKNKKKAGGWVTYTDPDQLRWYGLCFYLAYNRMPDRLGFVYFRYPYGDMELDTEGKETGEVEQGVSWVDFTKADFEGLAGRAKDVLRKMNQEKFEANPVPSNCRFCDFETICEERQAQKAKNRRSRKKSSDFFDGQDGVFNFQMGVGGSIKVKGE